MRVALGSDHGGVDAKQALIEALKEWGHEVYDLGTHDRESCDYPDFAAKVAKAVQSNEAERGVLVCGTGIGMALTANRFAGVRAAVAHDDFSARMCRAHNDANVVCFGARVIAVPAMARLLKSFLDEDFEGGRHERRVGKIKALD